MMHFNGFYGFSLFGFIGLIVLILYYLFAIYIRRKTRYSLRITILIISIYLIFILLFVISVRINISLANVGWYFPVIASLISEGILYTIKKIIGKK